MRTTSPPDGRDPDTGPDSKSQQAYAFIRTRITDHRFGPGYRLVLGDLGSELAMSVVPVREAIRRLEAEGLVTFERNVGARVAVVDEQQYVDTMQTLGVIEGAATALAAPLLDDDALAEATALNERMRRLLSHFDAHTFTGLNQRFHTCLFGACPNAQLVELVRGCWTRMAGIRDSTFAIVPDRARDSVAEHDALLELIGDRADPAEIERLARGHRWRTLDAFLRARHPHPTPNPTSNPQRTGGPR